MIKTKSVKTTNTNKQIRFSEKQIEDITKYAKANEWSFAEAVRNLCDEALKNKSANESIDLITEIIDERLRAILKPQVERLAAISSKGAIMSAASSYLNAQAIVDFVPKERRREFLEVYEKARLKGIAYVKNQYADKELQEQMK